MSDVKERPILFNGEMVRAILDGTKTMTRRIVKPQPARGYTEALQPDDTAPDCVAFWHEPGEPLSGDIFAKCPYGQAQNRLWVREALGFIDHDPVTGSDLSEDQSLHFYKADVPAGLLCPNPYSSDWIIDDERLPRRSVPSIHMPRWASRITLEITDVRVERLHEIRALDVQKEGVPFEQHAPLDVRGFLTPCDEIRAFNAFQDLWESINGEGSWDANPWVWVVSFERVQDEL